MSQRTDTTDAGNTAEAPQASEKAPGSGGTHRLSIVIPVYNGARSIAPLVDRLREELGQRYDLEIVLVNDCSPDDSAEVCEAIAAEHPSVRFVSLAKNFGEHNAVMAGLNYCTGEPQSPRASPPSTPA